ncbi:hypothetical protein [Amycolatopsis minnesotensis]|uniref:DUF2637 domain-containing protein n=1 Tax=Amycolatopsis minnesotensis TaxID=337894 RepID=A0ABP5DUE4_9PSEU
MNWQEERRRTLAAKAEQARLDQAAQTGTQIEFMKAKGEQAREDRRLSEKLKADQAKTRQDKREKDKADRKARWAGRRELARAHTVDLLIYGVAVVSFAMAAPAMAGYGHDVYASPMGRLLPLITELTMWAFAVAVLLSRTRTPERPVWGLQAGVWVFGAVAFGTNALHGISRGPDAAAIMGVVSVAGVVAHQLAIATPPKSRTQRRADRVRALAEAKAAAAARAAVRTAAARIDADGHSTLAYTPGTYEVRRGRLIAVTADPDAPGAPDAMDREIAALIDATVFGPRPAGPAETSGGDEPVNRGTVATQEDPRPPRPGDDPVPDRPAAKPARPRKRAEDDWAGGRVRRTYTQLRTELQNAIVAGDLDPDTASVNAVRRTLRCRKETARRLHAEFKPKD